LTSATETDIRRAIVEACRSMNALGLAQGTAGNISVRWEEGFLITPSGLPYGEMTGDDILHMRLDGSYEHALRPSSEWRFHRDIMAERRMSGRSCTATRSTRPPSPCAAGTSRPRIT
jgi:L-fuculose-phosphate aldolase